MSGLEHQAKQLVSTKPWPEAQPLITGTEPARYPLEALPEAMRAAVEEVQAFVQAPIPMVAGSALTALSLAAQSLANVQRAARLAGPCSLYLLTIAESGERKTTLDQFFLEALRQWQADQSKAKAPDLAEHEAAKAAFEVKRQALIENLKTAAKKGRSTNEKEHDLAELEQSRPEAPRVPRLLLGDETPEALAWSLARLWPSAGMVSSEAGIVFGGHAMGADSIMRNLALLNVLWDGGEHSTGRRSKDSFTVRNARLTVSLQVQPEALRQFLAKSGALARGSGFMARFLIARPASTQGTRLYRDPPEHWPALERFNQRLRAILDTMPELDDEGGLILPMVRLSPEAKELWRKFHDDIELELRDGGDLQDVRDVASKTADNAARIACLFHIFEGEQGPVSRASMGAGARIASWHLHESRRFFNEIATPPHVQGAVDLDRWLIARCRDQGSNTLSRTQIQQFVTPVRLRKGPILDDALAELEQAHRIEQREEGRKKLVILNPQLTQGDEDGVA